MLKRNPETALNKRLTIDTLFERYALITVFLIMVLVFSILCPSFFSWNNFINVIVSAAATGIATVGMAIVIMQNGIDLSAGSTMYLGAIVCSKLMNHGYGVTVFVLVVLLTGAAVGTVNGVLITRFKVVPFIATYGMMMLVRGVALTMSGQRNVIFSDPVAAILATQQWLGIPVIVYVFFLVLVLAYIILTHTPFGRQLYAIGNDQRAAQKIGIRVQRSRLIAYMICGACAACAGLIVGAQSGAFNTSLGDGKEFTFISAAVLGGVSLSGGRAKVFPHLFVGILIITAVEAGLVMVSANPYLYKIVRGGLIAVAVIFDSFHSKGELR